jgi:hypothetical protein
VLTAIIFFASYQDLPSMGGSNGRFEFRDFGFILNGDVWFFSPPGNSISVRWFVDHEPGNYSYKNNEVVHIFFSLGKYGLARIKHADWSDNHKNFMKEERWNCDLPGIYYQSYYSSETLKRDGETDTLRKTVIISLWYPIMLFVILPALWIYRRVLPRIKKA